MVTQIGASKFIHDMKQIYGIDLSKEKFDVNYINKNQEETHKVFNNTCKDICKFIERLPEEAVLVAEYTGVYGDLLVYLSNQTNVRICLASGYKIRHSLGLLKGKTDKLDAARIREYGERFSDKLEPMINNLEEIAELEELYSLRKQLVKERKMLLCHVEKKDQSVYCSRVVQSVSQEVLRVQDESIDKLEQEIIDLIHSHEHLHKNFELVTSIKGVGAVTASSLIIKTKNFTKLTTARKAASYAGVCPFPNSSGKMVKKSKVSPMSDKELKTLLFMCAKSAVKHNKEYKLYYQQKALEGKHHYLIMNNISNKLLRTIFRIIQTGEKWDPNYICLDPREKVKTVA